MSESPAPVFDVFWVKCQAILVIDLLFYDPPLPPLALKAHIPASAPLPCASGSSASAQRRGAPAISPVPEGLRGCSQSEVP